MTVLPWTSRDPEEASSIPTDIYQGRYQALGGSSNSSLPPGFYGVPEPTLQGEKDGTSRASYADHPWPVVEASNLAGAPNPNATRDHGGSTYSSPEDLQAMLDGPSDMWRTNTMDSTQLLDAADDGLHLPCSHAMSRDEGFSWTTSCFSTNTADSSVSFTYPSPILSVVRATSRRSSVAQMDPFSIECVSPGREEQSHMRHSSSMSQSLWDPSSPSLSAQAEHLSPWVAARSCHFAC